MVNVYITNKKIKGIDGNKYYYVTKKADIKFIGGINSRSTSDKSILRQLLSGNFKVVKFVNLKEIN